MGLMDEVFKKKVREYLEEELGASEYEDYRATIDDALSRTKDISVKPLGAGEYEVKIVFRTGK